MPPTISSRTPEGVPNHCPVCDALIVVEPSQPPGDAPCPHCGTLLWYGRSTAGARLHRSEEVAPVKDRIVAILCEHLGVNQEQATLATSFVEDLGADSLDIVELVMELEEEFQEEFQVTIPD